MKIKQYGAVCIAVALLACIGCSMDDDETTSDTVSTATALTDTEGNAISSGSVSVAFSSSSATGSTKSLSAAYVIDGVSVKITSGT